MRRWQSQHRYDVAGAVICLTVGVAVVLHVQSYPSGAGRYPGPGFFPGAVGAVLTACGVLLMVRVLRQSRSAAGDDSVRLQDEGRPQDPPTSRAALNAGAVLLSVPAYVLLVEALGFFLTVALVAGALMAILGASVLKTALPVSLGVTSFVWYVFGEVLRVPLPSAAWVG